MSPTPSGGRRRRKETRGAQNVRRGRDRTTPTEKGQSRIRLGATGATVAPGTPRTDSEWFSASAAFERATKQDSAVLNVLSSHNRVIRTRQSRRIAHLSD